MSSTISVPPSESNCVPFKAENSDISLDFKGQPQGYPFRLSETRAYPFRLSSLPTLLSWKKNATDNARARFQTFISTIGNLSHRILGLITQVQQLLFPILLIARGRSRRPAPTEIDPKIEPLVRAMNECGGDITTNTSCQGHSEKDFPPHVGFSCSSNTAWKFHVLLDDLYFSPQKPLTKPWMVVGIFKRESGLRFHLYSPDYNNASRTRMGSLLWFWFRRNSVDRDIEAITTLIHLHFASTNASTGPEHSEYRQNDAQKKD